MTRHFASSKQKKFARLSKPLLPSTLMRSRKPRSESLSSVGSLPRLSGGFAQRSQFLQLFHDYSSWEKAHILYGMSAPTTLGAGLYFHELVSLGRLVGLNMLSVIENAVNGTLAGTSPQRLQRAWDALSRSFSPGLLYIVIPLYTSFNVSIIQFQFLTQQAEGFVSIKQARWFSSMGYSF